MKYALIAVIIKPMCVVFALFALQSVRMFVARRFPNNKLKDILLRRI